MGHLIRCIAVFFYGEGQNDEKLGYVLVIN